MPAITAKGISKISPTLLNGAGVVTTRFDVHYVVTEYGVADLYGKTLQDRAKALIRIAAPQCQEELDKAAFETLRKSLPLHYKIKSNLIQRGCP